MGNEKMAIARNAKIAKESKLRRVEGVSETAVERKPSAEILSRTVGNLHIDFGDPLAISAILAILPRYFRIPV